MDLTPAEKPADEPQEPTRELASRTPVAVLGAGLVGGYIARTLAADPDLYVTVADREAAALERLADCPVMRNQADLRDQDVVAKVIEEATIVIGAMPGQLGYRTLETVISCGKDCVDISFFPEDPAGLNQLARERGVRAIYDCGVMPGLGGMLAHHLAGQLAEPHSLRILVGGLPVERSLPLQYKAPFSPSDVIEEYTRPARIKQAGRLIQKPALSDVELVEFEGIGTLEAFNTDGLRSLLETLPLPNLVEKTLRYPGTSVQMRLLRDLGFFSTETLLAGDAPVRPIEISSQLLFREWELRPGDREFTLMAVEVHGQKDGEPAILRCELRDETAADTGDFSMARTTGLPALIAAKMLLRGGLDPLLGKVALEQSGAEKPAGCFAPDWLGSEPAIIQAIIDQLQAAGIRLAFEQFPGHVSRDSHLAD